jgi:hypothetical protein
VSAKRSNVVRLERYRKPKCPKCKSRDLDTREYDDGYNLIVCRACAFPQRVKR